MEKTYTKKEIEEMLWIGCCHTSGMHDPVHFEKRKYICGSQALATLERFCSEIGINPQTKSRPECGWCDEYKEKKKGEQFRLLRVEQGDELKDDDGQLRYVLFSNNDGSDIQLTGYDDFCVCESWYSPEEIFGRFEKTGKNVDIKTLKVEETTCECPQEPDDFSGATEGDR